MSTEINNDEETPAVAEQEATPDVEPPLAEEGQEDALEADEKEDEEEEEDNRKMALIILIFCCLLGLLIFLLLWFLLPRGGDPDPVTGTDTFVPSFIPTISPSTSPTLRPTRKPTSSPTASPSFTPSNAPTIITLPPVSTETICPEEPSSIGLLLPPNANNNSVSTLTNITNPSHNWLAIADDIPGETALDFSGAALAMSADGRVVAVSAPENDNENGRNAGHVRVYQLESNSNSTQFVQLGQDLDGEAPGDWFGESVALDASGYRLAVGAGWNDIGVDDEDYNSGHVQILDYNVTSDRWEVMGELDGTHTGYEFGKSVSMSAEGTRVAVGASHCRGSQNLTRLGCAYLYDLDETTGVWVQVGQMLEGEAEGDEFGTTVVLSDDGSHLAVGAYRHDVGPNGTDAGQVSLYSYDKDTNLFLPNGILEGQLPSEWVGMAVTMSQDGSRVAIGFYDRQISPVPGFTRVYEQDIQGQEWMELGSQDLVGGFSVSMSRDGSRVAIGDYRGRDGGANSGHVYVYDFNDASMEWEVAGLAISGNPQEMAGINVALTADGQRVAVTAPFASSGGIPQVGATRVYDLCSVSTDQEATANSRNGLQL